MSGSPKMWCKFSAKKNDGTAINLRIVDAPKDLLDEIINQYMKYYVTEDPISRAAGVTKSAAAMEELRVYMLGDAKGKGHTLVCCLDNGDDQIKEVLGASMMVLTTKEDPEPVIEFKTEEIKKFFEIYSGIASYYDEEKALKSDRYFSDQGLFVSPEYRGLGIELEFLKSWCLICKEQGIPISGAWTTSAETQKAAELSGWETAYELQYQELGKKLGVTFEGAPPSPKFMIAKIQ